LKGSQNIVLTREKAMQLFGQTDVVGKIVNIKMNDQFETFKIGGIVENIPTTSSIKFDVLGNFDYVLATPDGKESLNNWHMTLGVIRMCNSVMEVA